MSLDELLLDAKLSVPPTRRGEVSRADLVDAARSSGRRVVGVTAPAGYGKSTLLAHWAHAEDRHVAWVSLGRFDDDPAALLRLLAAALAPVSTRGADLVADVSGVGVSALGRAAPRLASALRTSRVPFVLMLDDLHELRSQDCHDVLEVVLSGIRPGSQVVAASRHDQPHLARFRASGDAVELVAADLTFDAAAAEQIFSHAHVQITAEVAAAVVERTEGWAVGLCLAAQIAGTDNGEPETISGDDRYVADYLYQETFRQLPEDVQRFLRRTAVLEQLCAPLCDAVLGASGSQARLQELEASSSFLSALDRRRTWFRYHALYREFLLGELRRVEPDAVSKLHLRAADWYESNASGSMAVEHLLNTGERQRCMQLVTALALPTYQAGHISTVRRWLATLGAATIEEHPPLAVLAGWMTALTGQSAEAQRWGAIVDAASYELVPLDGSASFRSARAMLRSIMCADGPQRMLADATSAADQEPPWSPWRGTALCLHAEARLLADDRDGAAVLFREAATVAAELGNTGAHAISGSELALLAMERGRWPEAAEHLAPALAVVAERRMYDDPLCALAFAAAARLALHHGELDEANGHAATAMRARPMLTMVLPIFAVRVRLQLAKVSWAVADQTTARHLLREIEDVLRHRPALGTLVDEVAAFRRVLDSNGRSAATAAAPLTPAELRLLPFLQTHLTIGQIAERLFVSRNTASTEVASIYRKLGVSSRSGAVERATAIGLLGG